MDIIQQRA